MEEDWFKSNTPDKLFVSIVAFKKESDGETYLEEDRNPGAGVKNLDSDDNSSEKDFTTEGITERLEALAEEAKSKVQPARAKRPVERRISCLFTKTARKNSNNNQNMPPAGRPSHPSVGQPARSSAALTPRKRKKPENESSDDEEESDDELPDPRQFLAGKKKNAGLTCHRSFRSTELI